jgi:phage-related holin
MDHTINNKQIKMNKSQIDDSFLGVIKTCLYILIGVGSTTFEYAKIQPVVGWSLMGLMFLDWLLGSVKAMWFGKFARRKNILGVVTKIIFILLICVIWLISNTVNGSFTPAMNIIVIIFALNEGFSALGNGVSILTGKEEGKLDFISMLIKWLMFMIKKGMMLLTGQDHENEKL